MPGKHLQSVKEIQILHPSISSRLFCFAPPADQPQRATDHHEANADPYDAGHSQVHAGLDGRVVDELLHLFRNSVVFIQLQLDHFAGKGEALQSFNSPDEVGAGLQIIDLHHAVLIRFIGFQLITVLVLQTEFHARQGIAGTVGLFELIVVRDIHAQDSAEHRA